MGNYIFGEDIAKLQERAKLDEEELEELKMVSVFDDRKICELKVNGYRKRSQWWIAWLRKKG